MCTLPLYVDATERKQPVNWQQARVYLAQTHNGLHNVHCRALTARAPTGRHRFAAVLIAANAATQRAPPRFQRLHCYIPAAYQPQSTQADALLLLLAAYITFIPRRQAHMPARGGAQRQVL